MKKEWDNENEKEEKKGIPTWVCTLVAVLTTIVGFLITGALGIGFLSFLFH